MFKIGFEDSINPEELTIIIGNVFIVQEGNVADNDKDMQLIKNNRYYININSDNRLTLLIRMNPVSLYKNIDILTNKSHFSLYRDNTDFSIIAHKSYTRLKVKITNINAVNKFLESLDIEYKINDKLNYEYNKLTMIQHIKDHSPTITKYGPILDTDEILKLLKDKEYHLSIKSNYMVLYTKHDIKDIINAMDEALNTDILKANGLLCNFSIINHISYRNIYIEILNMVSLNNFLRLLGIKFRIVKEKGKYKIK